MTNHIKLQRTIVGLKYFRYDNVTEVFYWLLLGKSVNRCKLVTARCEAFQIGQDVYVL